MNDFRSLETFYSNAVIQKNGKKNDWPKGYEITTKNFFFALVIHPYARPHYTVKKTVQAHQNNQRMYRE
jgi:hypothetical protein